jgi:plasmid maintenance system antidote protein VapI
MDEPTTLSAWLENQSPPVTKQELGRRVGCSGEHIGRIVNDDPRVSQTLALRIFDETGVKVGPLKAMTNTDIAVVRRLNASGAGAAA